MSINKKQNKKILKGNEGFTLVELIVSLGLFIVVMMISTGALLTLSDTSRKLQSMRIAMDNLNLALESMSREIRVGTIYYCNPPLPISSLTEGNDCSSGRSSIAFRSQKGNITVYRINGSIVERSLNGGNNFSDVTTSDINIDYLEFYVQGTSVWNDEQPRVIVTIGGTAGDKITSEFKIQTTIMQRSPK